MRLHRIGTHLGRTVLQPYIKTVSDSDGDVDGPLIPVLPDEKSIDDFLTLKQGMKVALLVCNDTGSQCAKIGIIYECSREASGVDSLFPTVSLLSSQ